MSVIKVLIAEDDRLNRMMVCKLLQKYGADCKTAEDGTEALKIALSHEFDIVFLDFNMPGYSGHECAERIRSHCAENDVRPPLIVGVSADEDNGSNTLFDEFLPKPFRIEKVQQILEMVSKGDQN